MNTCLGPGLILWYDLSNEKRDMRFDTWNVWSLYRAGSLTEAAGELARYTVFASIICALFFSILAAEKSGCVKYADFFFVEVLIWVLF
jgi:hypothetical protein